MKRKKVNLSLELVVPDNCFWNINYVLMLVKVLLNKFIYFKIGEDFGVEKVALVSESKLDN